MGTIAVAWWNLENLFDTDDDPISQDFEFTKANGWTDEVYAAKRANLAAVLNQLHGGNGPELLGVAEVEGDDVFAQLLADTGNPHLKVATDPNPPTHLRGIDVSIAYDDRKLRVVDQASFIVHLRYPTRDIFQVIFEVIDTHDRLVVIASHWPSRRQGKEHSEPSRMTIAENIAFLVRDHVRCSSPEYLQRKADGDLTAVQAKFDTPVLILGDFNDEPSDASVIGHLQASSELDRVVGATTRSPSSRPRSPPTAATTPGSTTPAGNSWPQRTWEPSSSNPPPAGNTSPTATRYWTTWSPPAVCCYKEASPSTRLPLTSTGPPLSPPPPAAPAHSTRRPRRAPPTTSPSPPS